MSLKTELYGTEASKAQAAATTLDLPLNAVKSAHVRGLLDEALVTVGGERIGLDKVR